MTKQEFKALCHQEFTKRGFVKKKSSYYRIGIDGLLCKLSFQSSYGTAYYINCDYYLCISSMEISADIQPELMGRVFRVLSKDTIKGKPFSSALIDYQRYSLEELTPFIDRAFDDYVLPPLENGRAELITGVKNGIWHFAPFSNKTIADI